MSAKPHKLPTITVKTLFVDLHSQHLPAIDSWELRKEFLDLRTDNEFVKFYQRAEFDVGRLPDSLPKLLASMREWQRMISILSNTSREKWNFDLCLKHGFDGMVKTKHGKFVAHGRNFERATKAHSLAIFPGEKDGAPAEVWSHTTLSAMLDVVHVEKIEGYKNKRCALRGCLQPVPIDNYKRKYCSPKHASLATTRRWRKNKKATEIPQAEAA